MAKLNLPKLTFHLETSGILEFVTKIKLEQCLSPTPESLRKLFFINQGWRLTNTGVQNLWIWYEYFQVQNILNTQLNALILLNIDSCVNGPWHVDSTGKVTLFDRDPFFELSMFDGSLYHFVKSCTDQLR